MRQLRLSLLPSRRRPSRQSGIALVTTLLLLSLLTALSLSMVLAYRSDTLVNGYTRDMQASFYAADAGNTIIREDMSARLEARIPTAITPGNYPLAPSDLSSVSTAINNDYANAQPLQTGSSTQQNFRIYKNDTVLSLYSCAVTGYTDASFKVKGSTQTSFASSETSSTVCPTVAYAYDFTYVIHYQVTTIGTAQGTQTAAVTDAGNIVVTATSQDTINNFSQYGTFIDKQDICSAMLIGGRITGPQFTNGSWNFGYPYSYTFTDKVGSAGAQAGYIYSDGHCDQSSKPTDTRGSTTIAPSFAKGFTPGQQAIPLPTTSYNQEQAVLDGIGSSNSAPDTGQMASLLRSASGSNWSTSTSSGVFVAATPDSPTPPTTANTVVGGGIYVEGSADSVTLSTGSNNAQVYTIVQGSTTTTVTIDPTANTTTISAKTGYTTKTKTYSGVPQQKDFSSGTEKDGNACVLYVDGNINSLSGTVQNNTGITITAANDMIVTGNLVYATSVADASGGMINGTMQQTLGLYTAGGSVYLKAPYNNANMEIDASILVTKDNGGTCNYGQSCDGVLGLTGPYSIGTLTIVGGRIQSRAMVMTNPTINQRNVFFDQRYNGTFAPPFFPKLTTVQNPSVHNSTVQRTSWVLRTGY